MMILRLVSTSPGIDKVISLSLRSSVQNVNYQTDQQPPYPLARGGFAFYSFSARSHNVYHKVEILGKAYTKAQEVIFSRTGSVLKFDGVRKKTVSPCRTYWVSPQHIGARVEICRDRRTCKNFASCVIFSRNNPFSFLICVKFTPLPHHRNRK